MSVALLDVNVLVALLDPDHVHHDVAHRWFESNQASGWSSCPMTVNGCVRVLSNPKYPGLRLQAFQAIQIVSELCSNPNHRFWADTVSLLDPTRFHPSFIAGPRMIGDVYLVGLAVHHHGRLVTFDHSISIKAVRDATNKHLVYL